MIFKTLLTSAAVSLAVLPTLRPLFRTVRLKAQPTAKTVP